ncbi:FAD-binding domain-containing protein [Thiohalocapsa marina]|nr:FAD-binding domain-containing protein [Thiohalocapsa marina]
MTMPQSGFSNTKNTLLANRDQGAALLRAFVPRMGRHYAQGRNFDPGPGRYRDVSTLSPYIRRRLLLETEVIAAALDTHGLAQAERFIQEVLWRGYFKGWLEQRPQVWADYRAGLQADLARLDTDVDLRRQLTRAESGDTGLACFDAWVRQLVETGYLHNHARMWFASIWIFTLALPWRLGADLFYRHLLDGDPASNTLSWRWVAGLHTRGKAYQADAGNIARFTGGRFRPDATDLAGDIRSLELDEPEGLPPLQGLRLPRSPQPLTEPNAPPTALLITEEDCRMEDFDLSALDIRGAATLSASHLRSPRGVAEPVQAFEAAALADAAARSGRPVDALRAGTPGELAAWAEGVGVRQLVTGYVPEGPLRDWLRQAEPALSRRGIRLCEWRRDWDGLVWPHATAGFFKVRKQIPAILTAANLG